MKTAEEWGEHFGVDCIVGAKMVSWEDVIKQIQLDAMIEGARRAATVVVENNQPVFDLPTRLHTRQALGQAILTTSAQWTEKDL